jgi:hypothetical protein
MTVHAHPYRLRLDHVALVLVERQRRMSQRPVDFFQDQALVGPGDAHPQK